MQVVEAAPDLIRWRRFQDRFRPGTRPKFQWKAAPLIRATSSLIREQPWCLARKEHIAF